MNCILLRTGQDNENEESGCCDGATKMKNEDNGKIYSSFCFLKLVKVVEPCG